MAKSFKYKNDKYLDSTGIVHNKKILSDVLNPSISTGTEFETGRIINGKKEYGIEKVSLGILPASNTSKNYNLEDVIGNINVTKLLKIYAISGELEFPLPFVGASQAASITAYRNGNIITVQPYTDRSSFTLYVDVYYTKN